MLMNVFVDFDELIGYEIVETTSVDRVIDTLIKLENGDRYECEDDMELSVNEMDDVLVLRQRYTRAILIERIEATMRSPHLADDLKARSVGSSRQMLDLVEKHGGELVFYKLVINDTIYDASLR
jgi:hypothetical protein